MQEKIFVYSFENNSNIFVNQAKELDKSAYFGDDLGVTFSEDRVKFKVWAPTADEVSLKIYSKGSDTEPDDRVIGVYKMQFCEENGVWSTSVDNSVIGCYYTYLTSFGRTENEVVDVYARSVGVNGKRGMIIDLSQTDPQGWETDKRVFTGAATEAIIWETHVKDFSFAKSSGVDEKYRGKFLAFTQRATTVDSRPDAPPTCVDYLKKLGITHVQLNPFFDFATVDEADENTEQYNWGYDPLNYNAPEGSYSTNPYDGRVRVKECKQMIQALHNAGIGVIMDVVYNHTYHSRDSYFNRTVPNYYYRIYSDGNWSNGSGCGNDIASERTMVRKFIVDSVMYWASEYHIDGFRFDLMGLTDIVTMNEIRNRLDNLDNGESILMYGEGWDMPTAAYPKTQMATKRNLGILSDRIAVFSDNIRDALKGNAFDAGSRGFLQNGYCTGDIVTGIEGQSNCFYGWAKAPTQTLNYASCHDNFTLYDKLVASCRGNSSYKERYDDLVSMNKLCAAVLMTAQGIPFFMSGEEFCRSKSGDHNSYRSSPYLNMIEWRNLLTFSDVFNYYRNLIKIRKCFKPFCDSTTRSANAIKFIPDVPQGVVGFTLQNFLDSNGWKHICVILNGSSQFSNVEIKGENLPKEWVIIGNHDTVGFEILGSVYDGNVTLNPNSALIMIGYK